MYFFLRTILMFVLFVLPIPIIWGRLKMSLLAKPVAILACTAILMIDVLYVFGAPVAAVYLGTYLAKPFHLTYFWEQMVDISLVVVAFVPVHGLGLEAWFWLRLFGPDAKYYKIFLRVRQGLNHALLLVGLKQLSHAVFSPVEVTEAGMTNCGNDGKCHKVRLGDGIWWVLTNTWNFFLDKDPPKQTGSWWGKSAQQIETLRVDKMVKMSTYILSLCVITACVSKMLSFGSLHVVLKTRKIFNEVQQRRNRPGRMEPIVEDPDSLDTILANYFIRSAADPVPVAQEAEAVHE